MRRSRFGKTFYSCSTYPDCDVIVNKLEDLTTKYPDHPRTPYVKKKKTTKKKGSAAKKPATKRKAAPQKTYPVSPALAEIAGESELSRPQALKKTWDYIKKHGLQDPKDKRTIIPDEKLAKVFGSKEPVNMMKVAGLLTPHINK